MKITGMLALGLALGLIVSPAAAGPASPAQKLARALSRPARVQGRTFSLEEILGDARIRRRLPAIDVDTIHFPSASARITPAEGRKLDDIAAALRMLLKRNPREIFLIEGHTDKAGRASYNLRLSQARAQAVREALVKKYGIPARNLIAKGYGEAFPRILRRTVEPRNRRVTFRRITDALPASPAQTAAPAKPPAQARPTFRPTLMRRTALPFTPPAARPPFLAKPPAPRPAPAKAAKPAFRPWLMRRAALPFTPPAARPPFLAKPPVPRAAAVKIAARITTRPFRPWLAVRTSLPFTPPRGCPLP